jgi:formylglycine-generating enzyme required for sulfatase activity
MGITRIALAVCLLSWVSVASSCAVGEQAEATGQAEKATPAVNFSQNPVAAARAQCDELAGRLEDLKASVNKLAAQATSQAAAQRVRAEELAGDGKTRDAVRAFREASRLYEQSIKKLEGVHESLADYKETVTIDIGNGLVMEFVLVRAGSFEMGATNEESDEMPVHAVNITKPFYMGKYVVTQQQWQAVMGANPSRFFIGEKLPVQCVSWPDCQEFLAVLGKVAPGHEYRLPTEAQWEYACRAGTRTKNYWGEVFDMNLLHQNAWTDTDSHNELHPVGELLANPWGLYDMSGNVWQWCADWYAASYYSESPADDPQGPPAGQERVLRGGSFANPGEYSASGNRGFQDPTARRNNYGLRIVFSATEGEAIDASQEKGDTAA